MRLDQFMAIRGLIESREKARRLILAGKVSVNGRVADKPSVEVSETDAVEIKEKEPFVGRGGLKLRKALDEFRIAVSGKIAADIGASTGGFTDCLLKYGANKVYAVDVGKGQLDWTLRNDPRVVVLEGVNARYLSEKEIPEKVDVATIDVSFISLEKVLPAAKKILKVGGEAVALIKPQFEADRKKAKKGVVRDAEVHQEVINKIRKFSEAEGFDVVGVTESPVLGPAGNKEFLIYLKKKPVTNNQ